MRSICVGSQRSAAAVRCRPCKYVAAASIKALHTNQAAAAHPPHQHTLAAAAADGLSAAAVQQQQQQHAPSFSTSRRHLIRSIAGLALLSLSSNRATSAVAAADDAISLDLEKQLPGLPGPVPDLPKAYQRTMHKLVKALRLSIEAEAAGAKEFEVRRKADGAKDLVKEFVGKWQDNAEVVGDVTHAEMKDALSELGRFYQSKGPRARLNDSTKDSVLAHLAAVEAALPEEERSLLGF